MNLSALTRAKVCRLGNVFSVWEASHPGMTFLHGASVVFGKTWPLHMRMPLDCKYSNKGTFPLRSYQMENQPACFGSHSTSSMLFFFFFFPRRRLRLIILLDRRQITWEWYVQSSVAAHKEELAGAYCEWRWMHACLFATVKHPWHVSTQAGDEV